MQRGHHGNGKSDSDAAAADAVLEPVLTATAKITSVHHGSTSPVVLFLHFVRYMCVLADMDLPEVAQNTAL